MTIDYPAIQDQVRRLGETAAVREQQIQSLRERAAALLEAHAENLERLRQKVRQAAHLSRGLRCALPAAERLDGCFPLPQPPSQATIIAADGSQITPDRNAEVSYGLINVGAIILRSGEPQPPVTRVRSRLFYDEQLYTPTGTMTESELFLLRDLEERRVLLELAAGTPAPRLTFTDGPVELWGAKDPGSASEFKENLNDYLETLRGLHRLGAAVAGYVDKPAATLVVRLLEIAALPENELERAPEYFPFRGVTDRYLFERLLEPGDRSAVFGLQSQSYEQYRDELALHFFYLNAGRPGHPWLARVEIPAWVAQDPQLLDHLHAALVGQCRLMGNRPYPYLLHRAHETAVVTLPEKDQVTQMIVLELRRRGLPVDEISSKQFAKSLR